MYKTYKSMEEDQDGSAEPNEFRNYHRNNSEEVVLFEIPQHKNYKKKLFASDQFKKLIIQSVHEGIIVYDLNMKYQIWNTFMENLFSIPSSDVIGKHPLELFPFVKDAGIIKNLEKVLQGATINDFSYEYTIPGSGKSGWAIETSSPLRNPENEIIGAISTWLDALSKAL